MVEVVIFKVPDGTKDVLKALANRRGYMGLSDFLRDLVRRELQDEHKTIKQENSVADAACAAGAAASKVTKAAELGAPQA